MAAAKAVGIAPIASAAPGEQHCLIDRERRQEAGLCRRVGGDVARRRPSAAADRADPRLARVAHRPRQWPRRCRAHRGCRCRLGPAPLRRLARPTRHRRCAPTGRCSAPRQPARASLPISNRSGHSQAGFVDPQRQHPYWMMRRRRNIEGTNSFESRGHRSEMKTLTVSTFRRQRSRRAVTDRDCGTGRAVWPHQRRRRDRLAATAGPPRHCQRDRHNTSGSGDRARSTARPDLLPHRLRRPGSRQRPHYHRHRQNRLHRCQVTHPKQSAQLRRHK